MVGRFTVQIALSPKTIIKLPLWSDVLGTPYSKIFLQIAVIVEVSLI